MLLLPQHLSGEQAACRSLNSYQPVLWAPALGNPLPWDQQSCWTPGSNRPPFNDTLTALIRILLLWFEWTHPRSAWGAHSTSPRVPYKGLNPTYWSFLSLILAWSPSGGPSSLPVNSLRTWSQKLTSLISLVVLCGTETFHRLPQSHFNKCKP